jgi:hypothetical protein
MLEPDQSGDGEVLLPLEPDRGTGVVPQLRPALRLDGGGLDHLLGPRRDRNTKEGSRFRVPNPEVCGRIGVIVLG